MKTFLPLAALCMMVASCDNGGQNQLTSGLHLENFDTSVTPGTDFYQYATGGWQKNNPLPAAYSAISHSLVSRSHSLVWDC